MRYISLFSGIEAASVAWKDLDGWEPVAFSEIDKFPSAVLAYRFPDVPNLGDITKIDWSEVIAKHGAVDLIVGGSPCQSFSIAGGRESLDGESRLMFEYIRAVQDVRPKWFLWENVPGVLSTRDNAFEQLLTEMEKLGYGMAWGTLDAQFFGVAQRRKRVFLVGYLGNVGCAAAVLFDSESMRGNTQTSKQKREELTRAVKFSSNGGSFEQSTLAFNDTQITSPQNGNAPQFGDELHTISATDRPPCVALQSDGSLDGYRNGCGYQTDGSAYTLNTVDRQSVVCMTSDAANAAVDVDMTGTLLSGGGSPPMITAVQFARETARGHVPTISKLGS